MARTQKDTVSYFPHDANASSSDTLTVLQGRYGNDGYAFWFKLLEKLASTEGHYIDCRNQVKMQVFMVKMGVEELRGVEILNLLVEMQAIDKELWESKVIWCENLIKNVAIVYASRHREPPERPIIKGINAITTGRNCIICGINIDNLRADAKYCSDTCRKKASRVTDNVTDKNETMEKTPISTEKTPISTEVKALPPVEIPQSKVEESKVNNSKEEKATTELDFEDYKEELRSEFKDVNFDNELKKFYLYWSEGGRKLKRPKLALRNWMEKAREIKGVRGEGSKDPDKYIKGKYGHTVKR